MALPDEEKPAGAPAPVIAEFRIAADIPRKPLSPEARRALAEAEARRKTARAAAGSVAKELNGPEGPEPTRYGDWERKGIVSDF